VLLGEFAEQPLPVKLETLPKALLPTRQQPAEQYGGEGLYFDRNCRMFYGAETVLAKPMKSLLGYRRLQCSQYATAEETDIIGELVRP